MDVKRKSVHVSFVLLYYAQLNSFKEVIDRYATVLYTKTQGLSWSIVSKMLTRIASALM